MSSEFSLVETEHGLGLQWHAHPEMHPLVIDFCEGANAYRALHAQVKDEAIARACGMAKLKHPHILDGTAGLGRDALVLARLGATVGLNERQATVQALLKDALQRLQRDDPQLAERLYFAGDDCLSGDYQPQQPIDVVYLDPMYPKGDRKHKAAVKKDMQMFQHLVGADLDADALLEPARALAQHRVVVKRPNHAEFLAGVEPDAQVKSKKHRFDIYLRASWHGPL